MKAFVEAAQCGFQTGARNNKHEGVQPGEGTLRIYCEGKIQKWLQFVLKSCGKLVLKH